MAKKKQKKNETYKVILYCIVSFILGMVVLFFVNNKTTQGAYNFISCKYNDHSCGGSSSGGSNGAFSCTAAVIDECCDEDEPDNTCRGIVSKVSDCTYKDCTLGRECTAVYNTYGSYTCTCSDTDENNCYGTGRTAYECSQKTCSSGKCIGIYGITGQYNCQCSISPCIGTAAKPSDCSYKYCTSGNECYGVANSAGSYDCQCGLIM